MEETTELPVPVQVSTFTPVIVTPVPIPKRIPAPDAIEEVTVTWQLVKRMSLTDAPVALAKRAMFEVAPVITKLDIVYPFP